ncbi:universal stress protein [Desulfuromonas thiophila]|jgi:nucleotide-binding universal stress UspA family protein|uniref:Universal stress protein n=1 Tax=Desulfuromonas thiophila TaxID=57664 RepID=A0A1G7DSY7_9BACT|nr:universal stress protein [Desulfuromonas thiophila]MCK9173078.1 universal stress protein [Desulfuromonas thiophila]MDD3802230.1 universal stress protein [Desulfuromonas thiophila]MDY0397683.1 universal stress protein [Desulfuromonas thiophila]SDE54588.1 Nucleotide-binding universal stress protein, UspA family [Desulfuromonas thiophila]
MKTFKNILFATDFSECSKAAFEYAFGLAKACDAKLTILHVISEPVDLRGFYVPHMTFDALAKEIEEGAHKLMDEFCAKYVDNGSCCCDRRVVSGIAHEVVIEQAKELGVDMIVMGTHGRSGLDHVLFGSTAEKVVRKSPIPVLTVTQQA